MIKDKFGDASDILLCDNSNLSFRGQPASGILVNDGIHLTKKGTYILSGNLKQAVLRGDRLEIGGNIGVQNRTWDTSGGHKNFDILANLSGEIATYQDKGQVMILGDFNARTGNLEDFISNNDDDYNDYVPVPEEYESDKIKQSRLSNDNKFCSRGEELLDMCISSRIRILNGRTFGDYQDFYKEILEELILLTLDAQKAFDKLHHEILFNKMYYDRIVGNMWLLLRNMYRNVTVKVKWNNSMSDKFTQEIGVRQGAHLSTVLYKRYNNNILKALERSNIGARIGTLILSLQLVRMTLPYWPSKSTRFSLYWIDLDIVDDMTNKDFVSINFTKSEIVPLTKAQQEVNVYLGNNKIDQKERG
ncbi:unnamed protein product [Mytilus coruscus]|uniref:Reverse transcriptase domain-containing protein n=1 Tax=Mytilus coruscus TaxID=42192 RepID=A0A6J7ZXD0_MYTCO|nr:unnamed protein product [Mytilus coruscus]